MKQVMTMVVMSAMLLLCGAGHLSPPDIARPGLNVTTPGTIEQAVTELRLAETEEEGMSILNRYPQDVRETLLKQCEVSETVESEDEPWTGPAVDTFLDFSGRQRHEVLAVQHMVMLRNGVPIESVDAVITEDTWYYYHPDDGSIATDMPASMTAATEMDIYGVDVVVLTWNKYCWFIEFGVTFYLPVCFHEIAPGQFDGILDAWAPNPSCAWNCNGGLCAFGMCGSAWDGPGYKGWWDYHSCSPYWSIRVAKIV